MRILIVSSSYPGERIGGAEYQALLIARGMANLGHEPLFLVTNTDCDVLVDGKITIKKTPSRMKVGWKKHRHQVTRIVEDFNPNIVYVREFIEISTISSICTEMNIPTVSMSCHATETSPFLVGYHPLETIGHLRCQDTFAHFQSFLSIRSSTAHVCNTKSLQKNIQRWYRQKPIKTIYNGSPISPSDSVHQASTGQVIWVNNLKRWKRPEIFIELARCLPKFHFVMVGRLSGGRTFIRSIKRKLQEAPPNLHYMGPLPIDQVNELISQSDLLLYTSLPVEGFGNSFLQAWLRCVPTLSLGYELDGILEREDIGRCSASFEKLVADVDELMMDDKRRFEMGARAREYASLNHNQKKMISNYESLFNKAVSLS